MRRIAVMNQKGGVGKTTTVANLGAAVAASGKRVLLIDLDPQAHLSLHYGIELADDQPSGYDLLTSSASIRKVAIPIRDCITLVPSDIDLAAAEAELISVAGREMILREAVDLIEDEHDVLLIDCPPSLGVLTLNALAASDEVMIPMQAHFLALQGVGKLLDTVTLVRQRINPKLKVAGFILCMHDSTTRLSGEVVADLVRFLQQARSKPVAWADARIYERRIRRNIKLAEAASFGKTVFDYEPQCNGALDYGALAVEIFGTQAPATPPAALNVESGWRDRCLNTSAESERAHAPADTAAEHKTLHDLPTDYPTMAPPAHDDTPLHGAQSPEQRL